MSTFSKTVIAMVLMTAALWVGISQFLGSTRDISRNLDVNSLTYVKPEPAKTPKTVAPAVVIPDVAGALPERPTEPLMAQKISAAREEELTDNQKILREKLGIKEEIPPTRAIDVTLDTSPECDVEPFAEAPVTVKFRFESPMLKGDSMHELELLISEYRRCFDALFRMEKNPLGEIDAEPALTQRRLDELKYFFLQRQVPKTALRYPEDL